MSLYRATFEMSIDRDEWFDSLALLGAVFSGRRYWTDHKGNIRRTPGKKPILSHGRKPR